MSENKIIKAVKQAAQLETVDVDNTKLKDDNGNDFTIYKNTLTDIIPTIREESGTGYIRSSIVSPNGIYLQDVWQIDGDVITSFDLSVIPNGDYSITGYIKTTPTTTLVVVLQGYSGKDVKQNTSIARTSAAIPIRNSSGPTDTAVTKYTSVLGKHENQHHINTVYTTRDGSNSVSISAIALRGDLTLPTLTDMIIELRRI